MYSINISNYINPLTSENIKNLQFPELNITDDIKDLTKMKLSIIRKKITEFELDKDSPTISNSKFYDIEKLFQNFVNELDGEFGNPAEIKLNYSGKPEKGNALIKERESYLKEFKKILINNSKFIINNRDKILQRIDEVYDNIAEKVAVDLKEKRKKVSNEIITCECGAKSYRKNLSTHKKSMQHQLFIQSQEAVKPKEEAVKPKVASLKPKVELVVQEKSEVKGENISDPSESKKKPKKKQKVEEEYEEDFIPDEEAEEEKTTFEMDYKGNRYKYIGVKDLYTGSTTRDWKKGIFSQTGAIVNELDDFATKTLGLNIYVPPKTSFSFF